MATGHSFKVLFQIAFIAIFVMALSVCLPSATQAQITKSARVDLNNEDQKFFFGEHVYVTQDEKRSLGAKIIYNRHQSNLRGSRQTSNLINLGLNNPHSWMGVSVTNNSDTEDW